MATEKKTVVKPKEELNQSVEQSASDKDMGHNNVIRTIKTLTNPFEDNNSDNDYLKDGAIQMSEKGLKEAQKKRTNLHNINSLVKNKEQLNAAIRDPNEREKLKEMTGLMRISKNSLSKWLQEQFENDRAYREASRNSIAKQDEGYVKWMKNAPKLDEGVRAAYDKAADLEDKMPSELEKPDRSGMLNRTYTDLNNSNIYGDIKDYVKVNSGLPTMAELAQMYPDELEEIDAMFDTNDFSSLPKDVQDRIIEYINKGTMRNGGYKNTPEQIAYLWKHSMDSGAKNAIKKSMKSEFLKEQLEDLGESGDLENRNYFGLTDLVKTFAGGIAREDAEGVGEEDRDPAHQRLLDMVNSISEMNENDRSSEQQFLLDAWNAYYPWAKYKVNHETRKDIKRQARAIRKPFSEKYKDWLKAYKNYSKEYSKGERTGKWWEDEELPGWLRLNVHGGPKGEAKRSKYAVRPEMWVKDSKGKYHLVKGTPDEKGILQYPEGAEKFLSAYSMIDRSPDTERYPAIWIPYGKDSDDVVKQRVYDAAVKNLSQLRGKPQWYDRADAISRIGAGLALQGYNIKDLLDPEFIMKNPKTGKAYKPGYTAKALRNTLKDTGTGVTKSGLIVPTAERAELIKYLPKQDYDYLLSSYPNTEELLKTWNDKEDPLVVDDWDNILANTRNRKIDNFGTKVRDLYATGDKRVTKETRKDDDGNEYEVLVYHLPEGLGKTRVQGRNIDVSYRRAKNKDTGELEWKRGRVLSKSSSFKDFDRLAKLDMKKEENQRKLYAELDDQQRKYMKNAMDVFKAEGYSPEEAGAAAANLMFFEFELLRPKTAADIDKANILAQFKKK